MLIDNKLGESENVDGGTHQTVETMYQKCQKDSFLTQRTSPILKNNKMTQYHTDIMCTRG